MKRGRKLHQTRARRIDRLFPSIKVYRFRADLGYYNYVNKYVITVMAMAFLSPRLDLDLTNAYRRSRINVTTPAATH